MAAENVLAREVVELATKGLKKTEREIDGVRRRLQDADRQAARLKQTVERVGQFARRAFFVAAAALGGFIRAGLQGTQEGERLSASFKGLSTQIASAFLPRIEQLSSGIENLTTKLSNMSGEQQEFTRNLLEGAAAAGVTFAALSKLGGVKLGLAGAAGVAGALALGLNARQTAAAGASGAAGPGGALAVTGGILAEKQFGILGRLQKVLEGRVGQLAGDPSAAARFETGFVGEAAKRIGQLRGLLGFNDEPDKPPTRRDVTPTEPPGPVPGTQARGFEAVEDTFKRLQLGALKGDQENEEKKQTELLKRILAAMSGERTAVIAVGGVAAVGA